MTPPVQKNRDTDAGSLRGIDDVAALLSEPAAEDARPAPRELRLSALDETSAGERKQAYRAFLRHQAMRDRRDSILSFSGKILRFCGILLAILAAVYVLWFALDNFRIIRKVEVMLEAVEWQEGRPETVLLDRIWHNPKAKFAVLYLCESTGTGSFTYDPESGKSRLLPSV